MVVALGQVRTFQQRHLFVSQILAPGFPYKRPKKNPGSSEKQGLQIVLSYIHIEFVRTCQAAFIYFDSDTCYDKAGQAIVARSWNLSDDLGQIEYIFSDKAVITLTQNSMIFRECSIAGKVYRGDPESVREKHPDVQPVAPLTKGANPASLPASSSGESSIAAGSNDDQKDLATAVPEPPAPGATKLSPQIIYHFSDATLAAGLQASASADPNSPDAAHAQSFNGFFSVLALCHTVLTGVDPETGSLEYKAQSSDEAVLVEELERYQLLNILEFTSARKRMSVVLRKLDEQDGWMFLLCKGADTVIYERLKEGADELKADQRHLAEFASGGLRTLSLAYKVI
ncbi:hypothetical protein D9615_008408 [Tricholomella constricta]|uniref:Uncharacterized protein n=1 Tax=Tricholomella constricta TaxID=117010 RepID=A0A8H5HDP6_9AGAR|nr:hypothetical protein D9615_008408 [Tricholomella constricta]